MARLGDVFTLIRNGASIKQTDGAKGIPITRIETISDKEINREKFGYADIYDAERYVDFILQDNDILMSHINSEKHLGKTAIYHRLGNEQIIHGMNLLVLRADKSILLPQYANYYFNSSAFLQQIPNITKKSVNQASFTVSALRELSIPIIPISTQQKIVSTLDKLSHIIYLRKQQLAKLDELVKARFVEMFGDPSSNPFGWKKERFDALCDNLDSRRVPITASERKSGIYPYYGASGIVDYVDDYIFNEDILLISEDGANLVARVTPIAFSVSGKVWVNNHAHVVRFKRRCTQNYIEHYLALIDISSYITGTAQPKLNQAKLNAMSIPIPPESLQNRFWSFVQQVEKWRLTIQQGLDKLEVMKKALMQEYFG